MSKRLPCPPAPGPLEDYAARFDDLFGTLAQRRGLREYLTGLLLPRDRNKALTALAGMEPIVGAQGAPAQRLQFFLSESAWEAEDVNARRLRMLREDPTGCLRTSEGVLVIDETGDRKDGTKTDHVGYQYLGSVGRIANGIVSVSSVWADERDLPSAARGALHARQAIGEGKERSRLPHQAPDRGGTGRERPSSVHTFPRGGGRLPLWRESRTFEGAMWKAKVPYVLSLRPHKGRWAEEEAAHTPEEAAQRMGWKSEEEPGAWKSIVRTFKDGHKERWWAVEVTTLVGYSPEESVRLVAVTTEPRTLPANSTWYLMTNLPAPGYRQAERSPFEAADLCDVVRIYGLRQWVEQSYRQIKGELGFADFQVRSDRAIRRHWELVFCAFSFCWWAYNHKQEAAFTDPPPEVQHVAKEAGEKEKEEQETPPSWPVALRQVRGWLDPWVMLWRFWRAWSKAPPPPQLQALLDAVHRGHSLDLYVPV